MKYLFIYLVVVILLVVGSLLAANKIIGKKKMRKGKRILIKVGIALLVITICNFSYLQIYHHADEKALASLKGNETVEVSQIGRDYFFDGPGEERALVFIPGARVEETAYAPLLLNISEKGIDCFLVKVPSRMATFGLNAPDRVIGHYDYDHWYVAGHSLGGIVAALYAKEHTDTVEELVLLASYPTVKIPDSVRMVIIYGDRDGCLSIDGYEKYKANWPDRSSETVINGGNHSNFGNYGKQRGDGNAEISSSKQQNETAGIITE